MQNNKKILNKIIAPISFRIGDTQSLPGNRFTELLDLFDKYKGITNEITLFPNTTRALLPLDVFTLNLNLYEKRKN